jgi:hypothetical protein
MSKKPPSKPGRRKPSQRGVTDPNVDYGNTLRFLFAGVTDAGWRGEVGSGNATRVSNALTAIGISFPNPGDFDDLVDACQSIAAANSWNLFDNLRTALEGTGGSGAA